MLAFKGALIPWMALAIFVCSKARNIDRSAITCDAGNVIAGERSRVTCHFGIDVREKRHHFAIVSYTSDDEFWGTDVLRCHWKNGSTGPSCSIGEGVIFDNNTITNDVTAIFHNVTEQMAGRYACQLIPSDDREIKTCYLKVNINTPIQITLADTTTDVTVTPATPHQCFPQKDTVQQNASSSFGLLDVSLLTSVTLNLVFVVACILYNREKICSCGKGRKTSKARKGAKKKGKWFTPRKKEKPKKCKSSKTLMGNDKTSDVSDDEHNDYSTRTPSKSANQECCKRIQDDPISTLKRIGETSLKQHKRCLSL